MKNQRVKNVSAGTAADQWDGLKIATMTREIRAESQSVSVRLATQNKPNGTRLMNNLTVTWDGDSVTTTYAINQLASYLRRHFEVERHGNKLKVVAMQAAELDLLEMVEIVALAVPNWPTKAWKP